MSFHDQYPNFGSRILGRPIKVHWAGWESTTARLQQAGWEVAAEQDAFRNTMRLAFNHPQHGAQGITEVTDHDYYRDQASHGPHMEHMPLELPMRVHMGREVRVHSAGIPNLAAIDAYPSICHQGIHKLEDLAHFRPAAVRTNPYVLPEESVDELLSRILEMQEKAKTDYFRDMIAREGSALPAHRHCAQIISLDGSRMVA